VRGKYRDVILPMTVLRRLDAVLEPTKKAVLDTKAHLDKAKITNQDAALRAASEQGFYNTSKFTLRDLRNRGSQQQLRADTSITFKSWMLMPSSLAAIRSLPRDIGQREPNVF
jgi:type I restriction enzyme M protein